MHIMHSTHVLHSDTHVHVSGRTWTSIASYLKSSTFRRKVETIEGMSLTYMLAYLVIDC